MDKKKVVIGLSGGVDSSVAALLLKKKGYQVTGVTLLVTDSKQNEKLVRDAKISAEEIGIEHYVVDCSKEFKNRVIEYFVDEYSRGRTPNPCVECNKFIKYDQMLNLANNINAFYIATGHYAIIEYNQIKEEYTIKKSHAEHKDQTYMLYNLNQYKLSRLLMPLGKYRKDEVVKIAKKNGLSSATRNESQEICFIEDDDYVRFIKEKSSKLSKPGNFVDRNGKILGNHNGIINYTIGQRKGLGITFGEPKYVIRIDSSNNRVVLGDAEDVYANGLIAKEINFIASPPKDKMKVKVKVRYSAREAISNLIPVDNNTVKIMFHKAQRAITPGQSVVIYKDDVLIGGGVIENAIKKDWEFFNKNIDNKNYLLYNFIK